MSVIEIFKEISKIPRESGNEEKIADYLCEFAEKRNLENYRDKYNNVIIKKKTCNTKPIILQAHTDMVCEKDVNIDFDFKKDSIQVIEKDGYITANKTTLGADNGIGIAQILYILNSDIKCNIEAVFTSTEETTMQGAFNLDTNKLEGKVLLNLDGFKENAIIIESAAFYDIVMNLNCEFVQAKNKYEYVLRLTGLQGGHSGFDINKNRGNSSIILAEILNEIEDIEIVSFVGGNKFNVIPSEAETVIRSNLVKEDLEKIIENSLSQIGRNEVIVNVEDTIEQMKKTTGNIEHSEIVESTSNKKILKNSKKFLDSIINFPHGVINENEEKQATTSVNLGSVDLNERVFKVGMRSSRNQEENECLKRLEEYSKKYNMKFEIIGHQPGFETKKDEEIVRKLEKAFYKIEENKNKRLSIKAVHITVEVGIIKNKMPDLQVAIISPNIEGAHTIDERVEISSINRATKWVEKFIEEEKE